MITPKAVYKNRDRIAGKFLTLFEKVRNPKTPGTETFELGMIWCHSEEEIWALYWPNKSKNVIVHVRGLILRSDLENAVVSAKMLDIERMNQFGVHAMYDLTGDEEAERAFSIRGLPNFKGRLRMPYNTAHLIDRLRRDAPEYLG